jgi:DNA-binding SARP family transcriptional activator
MRVPREALVGRICRVEPRIVLMIADGGYGKTYIARQLMQRAASSSYCNLRDVIDEQDADRALEDACQSNGAGHGPDLLVLDEVLTLERMAWSPLDRLLHRIDERTRLAVLGRRRPSYDFSWFAAPHEMLTLTRNDLLFSVEECVELFADSDLDAQTARAVHTATSGWPVATLVLLRLAREGRLAESLRDLSGIAFTDVHQYMKTHLLDRLERDTCDAMVAVAALGDASAEEVDELVGPGAADALEREIDGYSGHVRYNGGRFTLSTFVNATVLAKYERGVRNVRQSAAELFYKSGSYPRAARIAAAAQVWDIAARSLDQLAKDRSSVDTRTRALLPLMPVEWVLTSPRLLVWYLGSETLRTDPLTVLARLSDAEKRRDYRLDAVARYGLDVAMFVALRIANVTDEALELERRLVTTAVPAGAELLAAFFQGERAGFAASLGRIDDAQALLAGIDMPEMPMAIQEFWVQFTAYMHHGNVEALLELCDTVLARVRALDDPAALYRAVGYRAIATFFARDREEFKRACREMQAADPLRRVLARFNPDVPERGRFPFNIDVLCSLDAAFEESDATVAAALLEEITEMVDRARKPFWSTLVRVAHALIPESDRAGLLGEALTYAQRTQAPQLAADVKAIAAGKKAEGPLVSLQRLIEESALLQGMRVLRVSVIDGVVVRGHETLPVRAREFEILALLALSSAALPVEDICDVVWPEADSEAALASLRMSVHRLRKQLGDSDAIERVPQGYRAGAVVACDIVEAERTIAACGRFVVLGEYERARLRGLFEVFTAPALSVCSRFAWYDRIEARIAGIRHSLGVVLGRDALDRGDPAAAIELAEALLTVDAYDEPAIELLVRALDAAGERAEAVRRFRKYADRLKLDYGVDTNVQLSALIETAKAS